MSTTDRFQLKNVLNVGYILCFHEAFLKVSKNGPRIADHRDGRPGYVCHAFTIPMQSHAILLIGNTNKTQSDSFSSVSLCVQCGGTGGGNLS